MTEILDDHTAAKLRLRSRACKYRVSRPRVQYRDPRTYREKAFPRKRSGNQCFLHSTQSLRIPFTTGYHTGTIHKRRQLLPLYDQGGGAAI